MKYYIRILFVTSLFLFCFETSHLIAADVVNKKINYQEFLELRGQIAVLSATIEEIREEVTKLSSTISETEYKINQKIQDIDKSTKQVKDFKKIEELLQKDEKRISNIEGYFGIGIVGENNNTALIEPKLQETELYNIAKKFYDHGELDKARNGFINVLKQFPNSQHSDNAYFWIGETYFQQKSYQKAILQYQKVIEQYSKGNKLPAALLKQGIAFNELGERENAFILLKEVIKKYPNSNEAKEAKKRLQLIVNNSALR